MAFGMSPFPLQFGTRQGGGGAPTAITPANADAFLASLGLTQAGTGTTWGETGQAATPLYAVDAAKVPLAVETIGGKQYFGPIVNPAGTNLALHGGDATNAAWAKTNITPTLALGGLKRDADWRGDELFSSLDNLTISGHVTETGSGTTRNYAGLAAADNFSILAYHTFTVTVGKYYLVKATELTINGNTSTGIYQGGVSNNYSGDPSASGLIVRAIATDLNITLFSYQTEGTPFSVDFSIISVTEVDAHTLLTATTNNATCLQAITSSSGERVSRFWLARGGGSGTVSITQDNGSTWADVTLTSNPQPFDIAPATLANPTVGIRIATSGDSVRLYGVQHQVAARPLRPRIGPTAGSTVTTGARTMIETLAGSPTTVHLKLKLRTPTVSVSGQTVFSVDNNAATNLVDLKANGSGGFVLRKVIASSETAFSAFAVAVNTLIQIEVEISASVFRYRLDGGSWVTGTAGIPGSLSRFRIGHDNANTGQLGSPILALDEMSTAAMMTGDRGWNKAALA